MFIHQYNITELLFELCWFHQDYISGQCHKKCSLIEDLLLQKSQSPMRHEESIKNAQRVCRTCTM